MPESDSVRVEMLGDDPRTIATDDPDIYVRCLSNVCGEIAEAAFAGDFARVISLATPPGDGDGDLADAQEVACLCLFNCARNQQENKDLIVDAGGLPFVAGCLERVGFENVEIAKAGCWVFWNLASRCPENKLAVAAVMTSDGVRRATRLPMSP
jgi:hypothetical protein